MCNSSVAISPGCRLNTSDYSNGAAVACGHGIVGAFGNTCQVSVCPTREVRRAGSVRKTGRNDSYNKSITNRCSRTWNGAAGVRCSLNTARCNIPWVAGANSTTNGYNPAKLMVA